MSILQVQAGGIWRDLCSGTKIDVRRDSTFYRLKVGDLVWANNKWNSLCTQTVVAIGITDGTIGHITNTDNAYISSGSKLYKIWFTTKESIDTPIYNDRTGQALTQAISFSFSINQKGGEAQPSPALAIDDVGDVKFRTGVATDGIIFPTRPITFVSTDSFSITLPVGFKAGEFEMFVRHDGSAYNGAAQSFEINLGNFVSPFLELQELRSSKPYYWGVTLSDTKNTDIILALLE